MILFTHRLESPFNDYYDARRWALELAAANSAVYLSYQTELLSKETKEWRGVGSYFVASLSTRFRWGSDHGYYDGPHCSFSLGFLHFAWSHWWCKKCMPDD